MSSKDAVALDVPEEEKTQYVRLDNAKGNMSPPTQGARWFQRKGVALPNGDDRLGPEPDEVGVLEIWIPPDVDRSISHENTRLILEEAEIRWTEKRPFSAAPQSPHYLGKYMMAELEINKTHARSIVEASITSGVIVSRSCETRNKTLGVNVQFYPRKTLAEVLRKFCGSLAAKVSPKPPTNTFAPPTRQSRSGMVRCRYQ